MIQLRLSAGMSLVDAAIQKEICGPGCHLSDLPLRPSDLTLHKTALIISNEAMEDIIKIFKSLKNQDY